MAVRAQHWHGKNVLPRAWSVQLWPNMAGGRNLHIALARHRWTIVFGATRV